MRTRKLTNEAILTRQIRNVLNYAHIWHFKNWAGIGSRLGVADITGVYEGKALFIEIKTPRGVVSPHQEKFLDEARNAGAIAFVARSIDDVIERLGLQDRFLFYKTKAADKIVTGW